MKKLISLILALCLFFGAFTASAADVKKYIVSAQLTPVFKEGDNIFSEKLAELYKGTVITACEEREFTVYTYIASADVYGWVLKSALEEYSAEDGGEFTGIALTPPAKTEYIEGDSLSLEGLRVFGVTADGKRQELSGYKVYGGNMNSVGVKRITVSYGTHSAYFEITVKRVPLTELKIESLPDKTEYMQNQPLDISGLSLRALYSDGRADSVFSAEDILENADFKIEGCCNEAVGKGLTAGTHSIRISYKYSDIYTQFSVEVTPRTLISLEIKKAPDSLVTYYTTKAPSIHGLVLTAVYDNGDIEEIGDSLCTVECEPSQFVLGSGNGVRVYYGSLFVELEYTLAILEKTGIMIKTPQVLTFIQGETPDLSALGVYYVYSDGSLEQTWDYTVDEIDPYKSGTQNLRVFCGEYSDVFSVYISPFYRLGDVNGDGDIKADDARLALRGAVELVKLAGSAKKAADADRDGEIKAADARLILRAAVGLEDFLKKEQS